MQHYTSRSEEEAAAEHQENRARNTESETTGADVRHKPEAWYLWWAAVGKKKKDTAI